MKAKIKLIDNVCFRASADSGHGIVIDGPPDIGGQNLGVRPMEMVLMGLGGCTAVDLVVIMQNSKQDVDDIQIEVEAQRADSEPKVFTKIHIHYKVFGRDLRESVVKRAVSMSAEKYCSVSKMLEHSAEITHDYEIIEQ